MGVNLQVAQIDGITSYNKGSADEGDPKAKRNIIDSCVHSTCKLIGHLGTLEYCHRVNNFRDYLKLKKLKKCHKIPATTEQLKQ